MGEAVWGRQWVAGVADGGSAEVSAGEVVRCLWQVQRAEMPVAGAEGGVAGCTSPSEKEWADPLGRTCCSLTG